MPHFGSRSKANLKNVHPHLRAVLDEAIKHVDFTIICGQRGKAEQDAAFKNGTSKVSFPNSAHNQSPSCAIDFIPYPFTGWKDKAAFHRIAMQIVESGRRLEIPVRSGGDWNRDGVYGDWDAGHIELHPWQNFKEGKGI